ncbi:MAG TPA: CPBP family intramembrane glutamic endopeptidase [Opitutaceae bacterium]
MDSLTQTQLIVLAIEVILVAAGILAWIITFRRGASRALVWDVPVTDTLFLAWAILFGAFLGQLVGVVLLKMLPAAMRASEAVQIIVVGGCFDAGCIGAWLGVHYFMRAKGQALPAASEAPARIGTTLRDSGIVFIRALPVIAVVGLAASAALQALNIPVKEQDVVGVFARTDSPVALAGMLVLAVIVAPVAEELIFRAGLFRTLSGRIGRWPAIAVSSSLFALLHLSWASFVPLFCLGALFCLAYERTRNLAVPIIAHGLFNLNSIVLIVVLPPELLQ